MSFNSTDDEDNSDGLMSRDVQSGQLKCSHCKFKTYRQGKLKMHVNKEHPTTPKHRFECPHCDFWSNSFNNLRKHFTNHLIKFQFLCPSCSYSSTTKNCLTKHINTCHLEKNGKQKKKDSAVSEALLIKGQAKTSPRKQGRNLDVRFKCTSPPCQYWTKRNEHLMIHMERHATISPFKCCICSYSSKAQCNLTVHIKQHHPGFQHKIEEGEESSKNGQITEILVEGQKEIIWPVYHCPNCNFWTRGPNDLHDHLMTHKNEPSFKCSECGFTAKSRHLLVHIARKKDVKHQAAKCILLDPVPDHVYADYLKKAKIIEGHASGRFIPG